MDTDSDSTYCPQLCDHDQDPTSGNLDQALSEEHTYLETMRGIGSFMGWTQIPAIDPITYSANDNPFAGPKLQQAGKVSVNMSTDDWLCKKLNKLNVTLVEGYHSHSPATCGLLKDQFILLARSQRKWYSLHTDKENTSSSVLSWISDTSKLNSSYSRIAKSVGIASTPPASRQISLETLRR